MRIDQEYIDRLNISCLDQEDAKNLGLLLLDSNETGSIASHFHQAKSVRIQYYDLRGKPNDFFRVRYIGDKIFTDKKERPIRYSQPLNQIPRFYIPRSLDFEIIKNKVSVPLFITEGEFKAMCGCKHGYYTLGIGGVWNWKSSKKFIPEIPDFDLFSWEDRWVYLVFDSDLCANPKIQHAAEALSEVFLRRGAVPLILFLPNLKECPKTGLDDFIYHRGIKAFEELVTDTQPYNYIKDMIAMNSEFTYITSLNVIIEHDDKSYHSPGTFTGGRCKNRKYKKYSLSPKGVPITKEKSLAVDWLEWPHRSSAKKMAYLPGETMTGGTYNTWEGWGVEPEIGSVQPWEELMDYVFKDADESRKWFESWCAYQFQNPGAKLSTTVMIWGINQGTGKTMIGYTLGEIFGGNNYKEITERDLASDYMSWQNCQFVMGSEITGAKKSRDFNDIMKHYITSKTIEVNQKYIQSYKAPNKTNFYLTSNRPAAVYIDEFDRRSFIYELNRGRLSNEFYNDYHSWLYNGGASYLFQYFKDYTISSEFSPHGDAPNTTAKLNMIDSNQSDLERWLKELSHSPKEILSNCQLPLSRDLFTSEELARAYNVQFPSKYELSASGMGKALTKIFPRANKGSVINLGKRGGNKQARFFVIKNKRAWERYGDDTRAVREHYFGAKPILRSRPKSKNGLLLFDRRNCSS